MHAMTTKQPDPAASTPSVPRRGIKYHRARIRRFLFTHGPNRLTGGRLKRRHLDANVEVLPVDVHLPRWPAAFDGLRIAHVSDFHLGELMPLERALAVVEQLARLEPDFIACTGDVVDLHNEGARPLLEALAAVGAPLGTAVVLGNHDELDDEEALAREAEQAGLLVLRNEAAAINRQGEHLVVAGVKWAKSASLCRRYVTRTCDDSVNLLLSHNPRSFAAASDLGIPLTLAGHTHGGQLALRKRPKRNLAFTQKHSCGLYERSDSRLFVTRGVGAWFPLRVNCPAEIALLTVNRRDETPPPMTA